MRNIVFLSEMRAGKDTLAGELHRYYGGNSSVMKFAKPLYDMQHAVYTVLNRYIDLPYVQRDRRLLQLLGTEWGRNTISPDLLTKLYADRYRLKMSMDRSFNFCTDCRFPNEAALLADEPEIFQQRPRMHVPLHSEIVHASAILSVLQTEIYNVLRTAGFSVNEPHIDSSLWDLLYTWGCEKSPTFWNKINRTIENEGPLYVPRRMGIDSAAPVMDVNYNSIFVGLECTMETRVARGAQSVHHDSERHVKDLIDRYAHVVINTDRPLEKSFKDLKTYLEKNHEGFEEQRPFGHLYEF